MTRTSSEMSSPPAPWLADPICPPSTNITSGALTNTPPPGALLAGSSELANTPLGSPDASLPEMSSRSRAVTKTFPPAPPEVMRAMVSRELVPGLHASTFNAWEALWPPGEPRPERPSRGALLAGLRDQVQQVSVGLGAVVRRAIEEGTSLVLEGVHLVPGYLRAADFAGALVVPMLVTLPDEAEHRRHFESRDRETAASRPLHRYMAYFDEIRTMQDYLEELARREDVPLLDGLTLDESAEQAVDVVLRRVMAALTPGERAALLGEEGGGEETAGLSP